jgi:hypothetical protein
MSFALLRARTSRWTALAVAGALLSLPHTAHAATTCTVSGTAFQDSNRNGVQDAGEPAMSGQTLWLTSSTGAMLAATTDSAGRYAFTGLAPGLYRLDYENSTYRALQDTWVPTTTGSLRPSVQLDLSADATVNFGWRQIVRSTDISQPLSVYTGPTGLRVESFDDVVPAKDLYDALAVAYLTGEAPLTTVRFDYGSSSVTTSGAGKNSSGVYSSYSAVSYVTYASWRDAGPVTLTHEYGHAWAEYHAYISQQDPSLTSYLKARGVYGDARIGTSMAWDPAEMIAEDYRQLFGSSTAAAATQMNPDIPRADQVPGLKDFLYGTFTQPVTTTSSSPTTPTAPLVVDQLSASSGKRGFTIGFRLSEKAAVTVRITDTRGALVSTVETNAATPSGSSTVLWDGKDSSGRRVKTTGMTATVSAQTADGRTASGSVVLP